MRSDQVDQRKIVASFEERAGERSFDRLSGADCAGMWQLTLSTNAVFPNKTVLDIAKAVIASMELSISIKRVSYQQLESAPIFRDGFQFCSRILEERASLTGFAIRIRTTDHPGAGRNAYQDCALSASVPTL